MFYCRNNDIQCIQHMIDSYRFTKYTQAFSNRSCRANIHIPNISTGISGTCHCIFTVFFIEICRCILGFQIRRCFHSCVLQVRNITVAYLNTASVTDKSSGTSGIAVVCFCFVGNDRKSVV